MSDLVSGGTMVDNIFLLFKAYQYYFYEKPAVKKVVVVEKQPDLIVIPFAPPRSAPIDIPSPPGWKHW